MRDILQLGLPGMDINRNLLDHRDQIHLASQIKHNADIFSSLKTSYIEAFIFANAVKIVRPRSVIA